MRERASERILVVDRDTEFRRSLVKTLLRAGYSVSWASDLVKAQELIHKGTYGLMLIDLNMPKSAGFELVSQLREKSPSSKVIVVSVNGSLDMDSEVQKAGAFALLHKPVKRETLLTYTARALKAPRDVVIQGRPIAQV